MPQNCRYPVTSGDAAPLTIAVFGACMIAGYPYENGGLFEVACGFVEKRLSRSVQSKIITLGGLTAPRAIKHLERRVFSSSRIMLSSNSGRLTHSAQLERKIIRPIPSRNPAERPF